MPVQSRDIAMRFFPIFIPVAVVTVVVIYLFFSFNQRGAREIIEHDEMHNVERLKAVSSGDLRSVISDLLILSDSNKRPGMDASSRAAGADELVDGYTSFSARKGVYDQIRYIDKNGMEVVRVNYEDGKAVSAPPSELQNKKSRYYFKDTMMLRRGDIFVSHIDLNVENGVVEEPKKPVMRIGTPVFDSKGGKLGIVLLNYLGGEFLGKLKHHHGSKLSRLLVLNREGYFLVADKSEDEWGFMYEGKTDSTFQRSYPDVWKRILQEKDGQIYAKEGLFTFATIYPVLDALGWDGAGSVKNRRYFLRIVSFLPASTLARQMDVKSYLQAATLVLFAFVVLSWFLARARARRSRAEDKLEACGREH